MKWLHDWLSSHSQRLLNSELAQIERESSGFSAGWLRTCSFQYGQKIAWMKT